MNPNFDITATRVVTGGTPQGVIPGTNPNQRAINFTINQQGPDTGQVWVILHGWNGDINRFDILANRVAAARPGDTVLRLDWRQASNTAGGGPIGLANGDNIKAATWIRPVADSAAEALNLWGVNGQSLNFIGHSLGTFLSSEIASRFPGGVNTITALDPASDANTQGGYDFDLQTPGRQGPRRFDEVSNFSRSFVGSKSLAGSPLFSSWADESILVDFGVNINLPAEHQWVTNAFQSLSDPNLSKLARNPFDSAISPSFLFRVRASQSGLT
jgi:pimeloyl-ACP methyl ester carboxylesterase